MGYKAGLGGALARPDAQVFPQAAVAHPALRLPCRGVADIHPDAVSLWDADLCVVRPACLDMVDAIPEDRRGLRDEGAGKLAVREPRLADAVPAHPGPAWALFRALPALVGPVEHWARPRAAAEPYTQDEDRSVA